MTAMTREELAMWIRLGQPEPQEETMPEVNVTEARERLTLAQQELSTAQAQADNQRRAQLIQQLAQVRADLRKARAEHQALVLRIHTERDAQENMQRKVMAVIEAIGQSQRERPAAADYLPDDPEVAAWQKVHTALEARRDRLIAERGKLGNPDLTVTEANKYEGNGLIAQLTFAEQNLLRALEGQGGITRIEGGVYGVS